MCPMCSDPEGYGSCSNTYALGPTSSFETSKACSASQTCCHFGSITCGSYSSIPSSGNENGLSRGRGELARLPPRLLSALQKQQLLHCVEFSRAGKSAPCPTTRSST